MTEYISDTSEYNSDNWPEGLVDVTARLVVREIAMSDLPAYYELVRQCPAAADSSLRDLPFEEFSLRHRDYIRYQYGFYRYGNWGIFLRGELKTPGDYVRLKEHLTSDRLANYVPHEGPMIGLVGLVNGSDSGIGELSYAILPEYRRRGYAEEAARAALEYGSECGFRSFEARIAPDNIASLALAHKLELNILNIEDA